METHPYLWRDSRTRCRANGHAERVGAPAAGTMAAWFFLDLRDRYGLTQVVIDPQASADVQATVSRVRNEFVLSLSGTVQVRPEGTRNPNLPTGDIEVHATVIQVLSATQTPPFDLNNPDLEVDESIRLRYRYLDLRREEMQRKMELRHRLTKAIRDFMDAEGFWEIETPILLKSTPEGARDYLVPSRVHAGSILCLAAIAPATEATAYGLRHGPLLPDCPLLSAMKIHGQTANLSLPNLILKCRLWSATTSWT